MFVSCHKDRASEIYALRHVPHTRTVRVDGCAHRLAIKASCVFRVFLGAGAVGVMNAVPVIFVFLTSKSAPFAPARVTPERLRVLRVAQVIVPKASTAGHLSVDVRARGVEDVVKRPVKKLPVAVITTRSASQMR